MVKGETLKTLRICGKGVGHAKVVHDLTLLKQLLPSGTLCGIHRLLVVAHNTALLLDKKKGGCVPPIKCCNWIKPIAPELRCCCGSMNRPLPCTAGVAHGFPLRFHRKGSRRRLLKYRQRWLYARRHRLPK